MKLFGLSELGFLPHDSWGGGPEGDGTELYADGKELVAEDELTEPPQGGQFLANQRSWPRPRKELRRKRRGIVCPSGYTVEETRLAPTVIRRRAVPAATPKADAKSNGANGHARVNDVPVAVKLPGRPAVACAERNAHHDPNARDAVRWSG